MALQLSRMLSSASKCSCTYSSSSSSMMMGGSRLISPPSSSSSSVASASPALPALRVTCSSDKPPSPPNLQQSVDSSTKQDLSRADIEQHQSETTSEKQSFLGARPSSNSPWPRPELDRRPETGDRSLASLFAVDGPAPETINGRMAMVGFVWALVAEKVTGLSVVDQLFDPSTSGLLWFGAVVLLFTLASIIPFTNGESTDGRRWGPFNGKAERWNGRLAMLGFAALVVSEMVRQAPILHI